MYAHICMYHPYNQSMQSHDLQVELFRTLAHPVRVRIIELLRAAGSLTVGEIQQRLGLRAANVSQHLAVLRVGGLVSTRRTGTSIWYAVSEPGLGEVLDAARRLHERAPESALPRHRAAGHADQRDQRDIDN